jgi:hypothetical protein
MALRRRLKSNLLAGICLAAILLALPAVCFAQSDTARIEGTVADSSGAIVSDARVVAINIDTGIQTEVNTNSEGFYVLASLRIGKYRLEIEANGFRKVTKPDIILDVNQDARIDIQLEAGSVNEVVKITGGAPVVESSTSSVGQVIDAQQIVDLPLNGRNFTQLATLSPGVTRGVLGGNADGSQGNAETFRYSESGSAALSVNGLREQNNNFQLDGIDNNESIVNTLVFFPPVEALQEFRVITNIAPAEFGRAGGAVVNAVLKSGTNGYHGSVFEFIRNSVLDARPTFSPDKPLFIRNQFGATIGGPIVKDKLFFFADYQGLRERLPIEAGNTITVPTQLMREGNFSQLLNPNFTGLGAPVVIVNPNTGEPFPNNIINIPLNPAAVKYLNSYPLPDLTGQAQENYFIRRLRQQGFNDGDSRIDYRLSDKDSVFGRFSIARDPQTDPGRVPGFQAGFGAGTNEIDGTSIVGNYTRTFGASLINEFRFGWVHDYTQFYPVGFGTNQDALLGIGGVAGVTTDSGLSLIGGGSGNYIEYLGDFGQYTLNERTFQFSDSLSYVRGHHTFKFGGALIQRHITTVNVNDGKGFYSFSDTANTPGTTIPLGQTGYEVANMLVGTTAFTASATPGLPSATTISWEDGVFAQDDWRATDRLTLNLGLRYDVFTPPYEVNNRQANYDPTTGSIILAGQNGVSRSTLNTDTNNVGPRLGFAYSLSRDAKTVVRGGYGIFYSLDRGGIANQLSQNPPFIVTQNLFSGPGSSITLSDPIPAPQQVNPNNPVLPEGTDVVYQPKNNQATRVQEFNLTLERQIYSQASLSVAYVGTRGDNCTAVTTVGGFSGATPTRITTVANIGHSNYNSLQVKLTSRPWHGFSYLASYTFAKATDDSPGPFPGIGEDFKSTPSFANGLAPGLADYDVRHRFTFAGIYELPRLQEGASAARAVVNGWQLNSIITIQDGTPYSVFGGFGFAELVGNPTAGAGTPSEWFNPAAFVASNTEDQQSPRNFLRGPGTADVDFSVFRKFTLNERMGFEFRAEAFNLFNHPEFSLPNNTCCGGTFGAITSTITNSERQIQFGLRFVF